MRTGLILFTALVIVVAFAPWTHSQGLGPGDSMQGLGPSPPSFKTPLIDDTKGNLGTSQVKGMGRYSITLFDGEAILLDSATGHTWLLTSKGQDNKPALRWVPIPRTDHCQSVRKKRSNRTKEIHQSDADNPFDNERASPVAPASRPR